MDSEGDSEDGHRKGAATKSGGCDACQRRAQSEAIVSNTLISNRESFRRTMRVQELLKQGHRMEASPS
jgi:hypothetical protein